MNHILFQKVSDDVFYYRYLSTMKHQARGTGQNATLEYAFFILIGIFRAPKWKENHPERLKKVYRNFRNES